MLDEGTLPSAGLPIMNRLLLDLFREYTNEYPNDSFGNEDVTTEELLNRFLQRLMIQHLKRYSFQNKIMRDYLLEFQKKIKESFTTN